MRNVEKKFPRVHLPESFDPTDLDAVQKAYGELERRPISSVTDLEKWIADWEELSSLVQDRYSHAHVDTTVDTTDKKAEARFMHLVEKILPLTERESFALSKKMLALPFVAQLDPFYHCFLRAVRTDVELFREENIPLKTDERKLVNEFEKIMASFTPVFRGKELTMQQVARYLEDPDAATRKEAFEARVAVRLKYEAELDMLYDRLLEVRNKIASNAGFKNFRDYQFQAYHRFDYTPENCHEFHSAIAQDIVPVVTRLHEERMRKLGVKTLRPWDTQVDPGATSAQAPFKTSEELKSGCRKIFHQVDPELGACFDFMAANNLLDLDSRKGKAPGGYCTSFAEQRVPFIFMNAAGTRRDVDTLLHEGGHSFHYFLSRELPLATYHHTGLEFAEVASMAMELLSRPYFKEFYSQDKLERVLNDQLRKILEFFPFMAMIDAFQHWVYTSRDTSSPARWKKWAELEKKFQPVLDWSGFENVRDLGWQYPHVFAVPFYYVEYGIAQLGALAVWRKSLSNYQEAVALYKKGLSLGGSKPLPELFATVGARFGMTSEIIRPLVQEIDRALPRN